VPSVAGFVFDNGFTYGSGFTVNRLDTGQFEIFFSTSTFSNFPALAVSAWGVPGDLPHAIVVVNDFVDGQWRAVVWVRGLYTNSFVNGGFQFVAGQS
jgi:hypothetical protein